MVAATIQSAWAEVKKSNPCPLCGKPDWCSVSDNGEAVLCRRLDPGSQPPDWKHIKDSSDGFPIFALNKGEQFFKSFKPIKRIPRKLQKPPKPVPIPAGEKELAILPKPPNDLPQANPNPFIPNWLLDQGVPTTATETRYWYSKTQWVSRFEWSDPDNPKGHDKTIRPAHIKPDGSTEWKKGQEGWKLYRLSEAIAHGQGKWVFGLEGEKCVEIARSLQLVSITWQGGSWTDEEIALALQQLKEGGVAGLVEWEDHDEAGEKKAQQIFKAAAQVQFPVILLNPLAIWEGMPHKGDIADWVAWGKTQGMSENDFLKRLEEEFRQEVERRRKEQEKEEAEDQVEDDFLSFNPSGEITQDSLDYLYGDKPWICVNDKLYYWTGIYYKHSLDVIELKRIADFLNAYPVVDKNGQIRYPHAKPSKVRQCLEWLKLRLGLDPSKVNPPGLNCTNGVLQIHWSGTTPSWQLIPHDKSQYYLYEPLVTYNPLAHPTECERMLQCLDTPQREIFLRTIAASLDLATVRSHKGRTVRALLLKGDGNNGKDTLREAVAALYGYQGLTGATLEDFASYDKGRKFPLARTASSRVNWASENTNLTKLDKIQSLKAFITGDPLSMECKGQDEREFSPKAVCLFNVNDVPQLSAALEAIQSRYGVLTFNKTFKVGADPQRGEIEADPRFKYNPNFLREQVLSAFLNRVLEALVKLMAEGIDYSCTSKALEDIQAHNSHLWQFCQEVGLTYVPGAVTNAGEIWETLKTWYIDNGTLDYEDTSSGKQKAIWTEQAKKGDLNIKGANQIIPRFQALFPKAMRVTVGKGKMALNGIGFKLNSPEPLPDKDGEPVNCPLQAVVSQSVSLEPLSDKDGEPVTPVFHSEEKNNEDKKSSLPCSFIEEHKNNESELPRLAHQLDTERVSASLMSPECLTADSKLPHQAEKERVSASGSSQKDTSKEVIDSTAETEQGEEKPKIDWVRYQGEVYVVAGTDGQKLLLRKSGSPKILHKVHRSQVEVGSEPKNLT